MDEEGPMKRGLSILLCFAVFAAAAGTVPTAYAAQGKIEIHAAGKTQKGSSEELSEEVSEEAPEGVSEDISDKIPEEDPEEALGETSEETSAEQEESEKSDRIPTAEIDGSIPLKYINMRVKDGGKIEKITYASHDWYGSGSEITKDAYVYLPFGYSDEKQYNVLYLMHGIGGDEKEWGMTDSTSRVKAIMDNLIYYGDIEPFIVVTPNGRSSKDHSAEGSDYRSFYSFGEELRNDLIPYIESHYSTYAEASGEEYDMTLARDHRAMAGLSMGGMQTINIGIGECADLISYFGAFSAAPTSNSASKTARLLKDNDYPVHFFYNICGTNDAVAYSSAAAAAKELPKVCDRFTDGENFMWQELPGGHDFNIWYLGFYNFARLAFRSDKEE